MFHDGRLRGVSRVGEEDEMAKGHKGVSAKSGREGVRIPNFDLTLHRGIRAVAARRGIPAYRLYEQIVRAFLASAGESVA
jgi:hypothetical protein